MCIVRNPDSCNYPSCANHFAVIQAKRESTTFDGEVGHEPCIKFGKKVPLKFETVRIEHIERNRDTNISVGMPIAFTKRSQSSFAFWVEQVRCKAFRLKIHTTRHVAAPHGHRITKDPKVSTTCCEISSE